MKEESIHGIILYGVIYKFINKINGMIYIGLSTKYKQRMSQHKRGSKKPGISKFDSALHFYGFENFYYYIIDWANDKESLDEKEIFWIEKILPFFRLRHALCG